MIFNYEVDLNEGDYSMTDYSQFTYLYSDSEPKQETLQDSLDDKEEKASTVYEAMDEIINAVQDSQISFREELKELLKKYGVLPTFVIGTGRLLLNRDV